MQKGEKMAKTLKRVPKLIKIYNFLNNLGHMKYMDVHKAKRLAKEIETYIR
jgi:hypothetical protein